MSIAAVRGVEIELPVVLGREVILITAVIGVGAGCKGTTGIVQGYSPLARRQDLTGLGIDVCVFLVGLPGDAIGLEQPTEVERVALVHAAGAEGLVIVGHPEIRAGFLPEIIRQRRVNSGCHVVIVAGPGGLGGIRIAGGHETVQIGGGEVAQELLRTGDAARLSQIVILHVDVEDVVDLAGGSRNHEHRSHRDCAQPPHYILHGILLESCKRAQRRNRGCSTTRRRQP